MRSPFPQMHAFDFHIHDFVPGRKSLTVCVPASEDLTLYLEVVSSSDIFCSHLRPTSYSFWLLDVPFLILCPHGPRQSPLSTHTRHPHACFQHSASSGSLLPPPHCLPPLHQNTSRGCKVNALSNVCVSDGSKIEQHKLFQMNHQAF